jgi:hypothetical protein
MLVSKTACGIEEGRWLVEGNGAYVRLGANQYCLPELPREIIKKEQWNQV